MLVNFTNMIYCRIHGAVYGDSSKVLDSSILVVDRTEDLRENCQEDEVGVPLTSIKRHINTGECLLAHQHQTLVPQVGYCSHQ